MDSFGDGWQGAAWTAPGWTDQSFTLTAQPPPPPDASSPPTPPVYTYYSYYDPSAGSYSGTFSFDVSFQPPSPPSPPLPPPRAPASPSEISVTDDTYNYEVSWELSCDGLPAPITGGSPYEEMHGVPPGSCNLTLMDSFGDGWQGAAWTAPGWTDQSFTLTAQPPPPPDASSPPTPPVYTYYSYYDPSAGSYSGTFSFDVSFQPPSPPSPPLPPPRAPASPSEIS